MLNTCWFELVNPRQAYLACSYIRLILRLLPQLFHMGRKKSNEVFDQLATKWVRTSALRDNAQGIFSDLTHLL